MQFFNSLLPTFQHFTLLGYALVFIIALTESLAFIGFVIPGSVFIILAGFAAAEGFLDIGDLIFFAMLGAICGDVLSFHFGKRGRGLFRSDNIIFKLSHLEKAEAFFKSHGGKSVFLGRFIGPIRPMIPFVAGLSKMRWSIFLIWNILSAVGWAISYSLLGFFFGQTWEVIRVWTTRIGVFSALVISFVVGVYLLKWLVVKRGKVFWSFVTSLAVSIGHAIADNAYIKKFLNTHPRTVAWMRQRIAMDRFFGLPLTIFSIIFLYVLGAFAGIIEDVVRLQLITAADVRVENLLAVFRTPNLVEVFLWVTLLGKAKIIIVATVGASMILWILRKRWYIMPLFISVVGSTVTATLAKYIFHRPRPDVAVYMEKSYSFPSGHATLAVALYGMLTYILYRSQKTWKNKINVLFGGVFLILTIGFSRLYLGVHYVSDVWGGYLLGLLWLIFAIALCEWWMSKKRKDDASTKTKTKQALIVSMISLTVVLGFYIVSGLRYEPATLPIQIPETVSVNEISSLFTDTHFPHFTEKLTGEPQEPISFIVTARDDQNLADVFVKAGWYVADPASFSSVVRLAKAAALNQSYSTAPMTPSFWNAEVNDFGFEKPTPAETVRERHHARFWRTSYITPNGFRLYVGTASLDSGIKWGITHTIKPSIDTERDLVLNNLLATGKAINVQKLPFVEPQLGKNASGDAFFTDGEVYILELAL